MSFWKRITDPYNRPVLVTGALMVVTVGFTLQMAVGGQKSNVEGYLLERTPVTSQTSSRAAPPLHAAASEVSSVRNSSTGEFPAMGVTVFPVSSIPDWAIFRSPGEWNRKFGEYKEGEIVDVPAYEKDVLTTPLFSLAKPLTAENMRKITAKLFYSTRFFGAYNIDAEEFTGPHAGIDLKLAESTPVGAVAGGRVQSVRTDRYLGLHVIIEHHTENDVFYSIYGHFGSVTVKDGEDVVPGQTIGTVGMTGNTTAPHLHLQIDKDRGISPHIPYRPEEIPTRAEAEKYTVHPVSFITEYSDQT